MTANIIVHAAHDRRGHIPPGHQAGYILNCPACQEADRQVMAIHRAYTRDQVRLARRWDRRFAALVCAVVLVTVVVVAVVLQTVGANWGR